MTEERVDRETLVALLLKRAEQVVGDADWLVEEGKFDIAAGRYYYACFYAIRALFVNDGVVSKSHKGVQQIFLREYVKTGIVSMSLGAWLSRMERLRELADYNCSYNISEEEVRSMHQPAHDIISTAKQLISC